MNARIDFLEAGDARTPPYSIEAEAAILGSLLLDNSAWDRLGDMLTEGDFYRHEHRLIFGAIAALLIAGKGADTITVWEHLKAQGEADRVSLIDLSAMAQYIASRASQWRYAEIIRDRSLSRRLIAAAAEITDLGFDAEQGFDERLESASAKLAGLQQSAPRDEWVGAHEGMTLHSSVLEDRAAGKNSAWSTGLRDLDELLEGGLNPGSLVIIGARPSMGKTAFAMTVGLNMAQHHATGMLSMEMPHSELNDRMTAMLGRVSLSAVKRPSVGKGLEWDRVVDGIERAKQLRWHASDQGNLTMNQVRSKARNLKRLHGLEVLIVDYIGLMAGADPKQPRAYQLEDISRGLKTLAKELDIAVICLAQVNRKVEERTEHAPVLSDLRDSGAIEQDADIVAFIHRPIQKNQELGEEWRHYAKLTLAKNRQGCCGVVNLFYQGEQTRFDNWSGAAPSASSFAPAKKGFSYV